MPPHPAMTLEMKTLKLKEDKCLDGGPWTDLESGAPKDMSTSKSLDPVNVTLFRKRACADVIKLGTLRRDYPGLPRWALNLMANVSVKDREEPREDRDWRDIAREWEQPPALEKAGTDCPQRLRWGHGPEDILISHFWPPEL